jgi:hypothetical protein
LSNIGKLPVIFLLFILAGISFLVFFFRYPFRLI